MGHEDSRPSELISVCAGVILLSGKVLLARRASGRSHEGLWEFPGGRIEPGETPGEALRRELREELGIEAEIGAEAARSRVDGERGVIELIALLVPRFTGEITLSDHDRIAWVEARRLTEYDLIPADVEIAQAVAAHRRRKRYRGTHPRSFEEKYKEHRADPVALAKAKGRGSTPASAHWPIMLDEVAESLEPLAGATILDCTLGWGGHAEELARRAGPRGSLIALDRDGEELKRAADRLRGLGLSLRARQSNFADARKVLKDLGLDGVDALLADLGVSSMQLDRPERGMSFKASGPLDMRMDRSRGKTATQWLSSATKLEIEDVLRRYGQEPDAQAIAAKLSYLAVRGKTPQTTGELAGVIGEAKKLKPGRFRKKDASATHPAARTFQALRIVVNAELSALASLLGELPKVMRPGGRAALLCFHSGEEALIKSNWREQAAAGLWRGLPESPLKPSPDEIRANPRARSARLWRVVRI